MSGSVARGFGLNGKSIYMNVAKPEVIECSFSVLSTDPNGLTSLKSNGYIQAAYMHSTAPAAGNPNPENGILQIQLKNNFNKFLGLEMSSISTSQTSTKIDNSALVAGAVYVISILGNASLAKWQAIGVPVGITPAVGVSFVALTDGGAGNVLTSRVMVPNPSTVAAIEVFGNPDLMVVSNIASNGGQYLIAQLLDFAGALVAPVDGSIIKLALWFDGSTVSVDGL